MTNDPIDKLNSLACLIGNTPLLAVELFFAGQPRTIYAKAEHLNFTGSIKDRMAFGIMKQSYARGELKPGAAIIEVTSGNTGIAFAALGRALGHPVTIFMADWVSRERSRILAAYGAEIIRFSEADGGFPETIRRAEIHAAAIKNGFLPRQFANHDNITAHQETTGPEIWHQLGFHGLTPDAFVAGVGTGGTLMGVGRYLRFCNGAISLHPVQPRNAPLAGGGDAGSHRIEGIADGFLPPIVDLGQLDEPINVDDGDAIIMAQKLAADLGLGVGISSGANLLAALQLHEKMGKNAVVVTVFADDNKKYLSTDLLQPEQVREHYLAPRVKLLALRAFKRVCYTCCDPEECMRSAPLDYTRKYPPPPCPRRRI